MKEEIKKILDDLLFTTTLPKVLVKLSEKKLYQLKDYITNLQEKCENYRKLKERYQLEKEYYKQRNKKAIEYIEEHQRKDEFLNLNEWQTRELLNILKGDKDE